MSSEFDKTVENLSFCIRHLIVQLSDLDSDYKQLLSSYECLETRCNLYEKQLKDNGIDPEIPF